VAPISSALPLEQLVLEAVAMRQRYERAPTLDELDAMFGIGLRPMLDLIQPLWYRGHITVDPELGTIELTEATRARLESPNRERRADLADGSWSEERVTVLRDLVTGHILRPMRFAGQRKGFEVPDELPVSGGRLSGAETAELLEVVKKMLKPTFAMRDKTLISAVPITLPENQLPEKTVVHLRAFVSRDTDGEALRFVVREPRRIAARVRADIGERLGRSAAAHGDLMVFKNIRRRTPLDTAAIADPLDQSLEELAESCRALPSLSPTFAAEMHRECARVAEDIVGQLQIQLAGGARVRVLGAASEFVERVRYAIQTARSQIVLTCPFGTWDGYAQFKQDIENAVRDRGVRVVLVWGLHATDEFLRGTMRLAADPGKGKVLRSTQAARVHAKVVIRDADLALVGSTNFLGDPSLAAQCGVIVEAEPGEVCPLAVDLLSWTKEVIPEFEVRHSLSIPARPVADPGILPSVPRSPEVLDASSGAPLSNAAELLSVWAYAWTQFLAQASMLALDAKRQTRLTHDEEHRRLLLRAIREAQWRLFISSDYLRDSAFDLNVEGALRERLQMGLPTVLLWRRSQDALRSGEIAQRLEKLVVEFSDTLWLIDVNNHSKVLIWDDEAVVTSFNFLAFEGQYDGFRGSRLAREVGVHVKTPELSDDVIARLHSQLPSAAKGHLDAWRAVVFRPQPTDESVDQADAPIAISALSEVQRFLTALGTPGQSQSSRHAIIRRHVDRMRYPAEALEALLRYTSLSDDEMHFVMICALRRQELRSHPAFASWLRSVATQFWRERRFFETAAAMSVVNGADNGGNDENGNGALPHLEIAFLAAVAENADAFAKRLSDLYAVGLKPNDAAPACLLGALALLRFGNESIADALRAVASDRADVAARIASLALAWWDMTMAPLPLNAVEHLAREQEHAAAREEKRVECLAALQQGRRPRFPTFTPGDETLVAIFGPKGTLGQLYDAVAADKASRASALMAELPSPEDVVLKAWSEVRDRSERLEGGPRVTMLRLTRKALEAAEAWIQTLPAEPSSLADHEIVALRSLQLGVDSIWLDLEAQRRSPVTGVLFEKCGELLAPLRRWSPA
jgi:phosphatidylserine/phosphatidylglycerophosphate/cardiolipin synthase-like enzyme